MPSFLSARTSKAVKLITSLFFCYHVAAVGAVNFPPNTALSRYVYRPFSYYIALFAQNQSWDMFDTIPYDHKLTIEVLTQDAQGKNLVLSPFTPRLVENDPRLSTLFYRLYPSSNACEECWSKYILGMCNRLKGEIGKKLEINPQQVSFSLNFVRDQLRSLEQIRNSGILSDKVVMARGPVSCMQ